MILARREDVPRVIEYEVHCGCGARWRVRLEFDEDQAAECIACGADTFDLIELGPVRSIGRDVDH